ncbi:MAG: hypothetical protein Q8918_16085 [Bacteroidota bacterium]|nr:hypothetical protein [Bacteroidota bacterium]MDP4213658.1 hypothetical protein [Bacteroidota bacterium]MDP4251623.1 hypothetical protein [Bacteroidota bacterium]
MKKLFPSLILLLAISCKNGKNAPDVSGISVNTKIERFDQAFFALDSNHIQEGLLKLNQQFPYFLNDFTVNILGAGPLSDTSVNSFIACRQFLTSYQPVKDSITAKFKNMREIENGLKRGFQYIKYYFPSYQLPPKVVSYIGPFDAPGVALTRYTLAIGLQLYAGRDFSFYHSAQGQELFPLYISRRFEPEYVVPNCMKALEEDIFPDPSQGKPLVEQMIEKGKYWWLLDKFLPECTDSLKTGFTGKQLEWCKHNEGQIWNFFLQNDLYTIDPELIKNYIGDAPYTQGMPGNSPGNIGQWVGWQIVQKYAAMHPDLAPEAIMKAAARGIFDEVKYKPR